MLIDGEKFACEACVRGHRVSNCQHTDRPLQHINKKGRPVSQCAHCRSARKSRAAHIKCDCGEKTSKCAHLQPTVEGHRETCCCNHGGRCTCALKKDIALDTVPESDSEGESSTLSAAARAKLAARKRRANTIHSDGFMLDQNGNYKPTAKHSRVTQKNGPFTLNRANSATSAGSMGSEGIEATTRRVRSEAASPLMTGSSFPSVHGLPPLDLSAIDNQNYLNGSMDLFASGMNSEFEAPMYSAGLSAASVDWSHYDLADVRRDNITPSSYSQTGAQSFNGLFDMGSSTDGMPPLANTTSTSGDVSEVEDFMPGAEGDFDNFGNSFMRNNMLGADISSIDYDSFYKGSENNTATVPGVSMVEEDPAFWMPNYNDGLTQESPDPLAANPLGTFWDS